MRRRRRVAGGDAPAPWLADVTFEVSEWFKGGSGAEVTVDLVAPESNIEDAPPLYGVGSRLLVSGAAETGEGSMADAIAWTCGFTRSYDERTAGR